MTVDLNCSIEHNKFLIPDAYMLLGTDNWNHYKKQALKASKKHHWITKVPQAFWRGADSGQTYGISEDEAWANLGQYFPRMELVRLSHNHPDKINARLTTIYKVESDVRERMRLLGIESMINKTFMNVEQHVRYRYLVSVDGWTAAWMRVPWILSSNSLLLRQSSPRVEWFDYALQPMVHYYPINWNLSNLVEAVDYLEKNQEEAQDLVRAANSFAEKFFSEQAMNEYTMTVFGDYAAAQRANFTEYDKELVVDFDMSYLLLAELE